MFELNCSVNTKIRSRAFRQRLIESDLNCHGPLLHCGIDACDVAIGSAVASVDHRFLTNLNILRLSLSNFDLRFQLCRVSDACQVIAHFHPLSDLHRQLLQDTRHTGAHVQRFHLVSF